MSHSSAACAVCGRAYEPPRHMRAYQNLCPNCWSSDKLREWDRLDNARQMLAPGRPDTLTLAEWLHTVAAWNGKCALCQQVYFQRLALLVPNRGLVAENAIPVCRGCDYHLRRDFAATVARVIEQMSAS